MSSLVTCRPRDPACLGERWLTTVRVNTARLRHEMARRGLHGADLERLAKISDATVSQALRGRCLRAHTVRKMASR